jgi:hypothetical protein
MKSEEQMKSEEHDGKSLVESHNEIVTLLYQGLKVRLKDVPNVKDIIVYLEHHTFNIITLIKIGNTRFSIPFDVIRKADMIEQIIQYMQDYSDAYKHFVDKVAPFLKKYIYPETTVGKDSLWSMEPTEDNIENGFIGFQMWLCKDPTNWESCCEYIESGTICAKPIKKTFYILKGNVGCTFTKDITDNKSLMKQAMNSLKGFMERKKDSKSRWLIGFTYDGADLVTTVDETRKGDDIS